MRLKIVRTSGPDLDGDAGVRVLDRGTMTLGRGDACDWPLPDPERTLSKQHCELAYQGTVYVLRDTSTNGVFVNDAAQPLGRGNTVVLKHGDRFRAAAFAFRVEMLVEGSAGNDAAPRFTDPGSPLDKSGFGASAGAGVDPFDAFSAPDSAGRDDALFAALDPTEDDWGRDTGAGGSFDGDSFGTGFGAMDFPDPQSGGAPKAVIPDDFEIDVPLAEPEGWGAPAAPAGGMATGLPDPRLDRLTSVAATVLETVLRLDRQLETIARHLDIATSRPGAADRLPSASGLTLVDHLLAMPDAESAALLVELDREMDARAQLVVQTLAARPSQPDSSADTPSPFGEDPFE